MAVRNASNVVQSGETVTGQVPPNYKGVLILRVKEAAFGPSKASGLPQMTWTLEVAHPLEVKSEFDGKTYGLDSKDLKMYISLSETKKDGSPSDSLHYIINELHPKLGLPAEIDDENPNLKQYEGICFQILAETEERKEQRKLPGGGYELVKDADGNEISRGWQWKMMNVRDILKKAEVVAGRAF